MSDDALPWLGPLLAKARREQRSHAVLLHGPAGVGQFELAQALAAAWLCEAAGDDRPCGRCGACKLVAARTHPDLWIVVPYVLRVSLGWSTENDDEDVGHRRDAKQPSKLILIGQARALQGFAQTTPARGRGKVAVIHPAERMNAEAANALLKTLEEPPGGLRLVLATAAPDALLPTVRSRCQAFAVPLPPAADAAAWLAGQGVAQPEVLLAACGGQPLDALQSAADGLDAALWLRLPALLRAGDAGPLVAVPLPRLVDALQKCCHDLLRHAGGSAPRYLPAEALPPAAGRDGLLAWGASLRAAARHAEHPWQAALAVESLVQQGQRALAREGIR